MATLPDGTNGPHVFVEDLDQPRLSPHDLHHLKRVLRLRPGNPITICDGAYRWRSATFDNPPVATGDVVEVSPPLPRITIGFVVPKGDRPSWIVQKLTELGVDEIHLLRSQRSVVKWNPDQADKQLKRLERIAREAAMQSRQVRVPTIKPVTEVRQAAKDSGASLTHRNGTRPSLNQNILYIGPEGVWDDSELVDMPTVNLGSSVLRAETAAVTAAAALSLLREDLLDNHSP